MKDIIVTRLKDAGRCVRDLKGLPAERRKALNRSLRCDFNAAYRVNGQTLCRNHAVNEVFRLVLDANS